MRRAGGGEGGLPGRLGALFHALVVPRAVDGADCLREDIVGCTTTLTPQELRVALGLDLFLLSRCAVVGGTLLSTFSRLILVLAVGNGVVEWGEGTPGLVWD